MKLSEAVEFTRSVRETWQPEAAGYPTTVVNINHVHSVLGDPEVSEITSHDFNNLTVALKHDGKSSATINRITSALSTVLRTLSDYDMLDKLPKRSTLKEPRGRVNYFSEDEISKLVTACSELRRDGELMKDAIVFAVKTGCRQGEQLKLTWDDINWDTDELTFYDTKTGDDRVLPLTYSLKELLTNRWNKRTSHEYVFSIHKDTLLRRLKEAMRIAELPEGKVWHEFRHTAATLMFDRQIPLPAVKDLLGHKNTATTLRYSHATLGGKKRALDALDDLGA
jgi:integrase